MRKAIAFGLLTLLPTALTAAAVEDAKPKVGFSGYADADVVSDFGTDFQSPSYLPGMEIRLTTSVAFNPRLNGFIYTRLNDGLPGQGTGNPFDSLNFDGASVAWKYNDNTDLLAGDLLGGTGYFNYYRYKRTAAVVPEHYVRGAGFRRGGFELHTGAAEDTSGTRKAWATYMKWDLPVKMPPGNTMVWTPSLKYTAGDASAYPFDLGLSFKGRFENGVKLDASVSMNYWNNDRDPGTAFLVEPHYDLDGLQVGDFSLDGYAISATFFYSDKGDAPSTNVLRQSRNAGTLDDFFFYLEPTRKLNKTYTVGLPLEYHNPKFDVSGDDSFWIVPSLYIHPAGPNAEWWLWVKGTQHLSGFMAYSLGSEITLTF